MSHSVSTLLRRQGLPLAERELRSRGSIVLPMGLALCVTALATFQVRVQSSPLITEPMWNSLPLGRDPTATLANLMAAGVAFQVVVARTDLDRESGWLPVMHAQGIPAWSYALAIWIVAAAKAVVVLLLSAMAIQLVRSFIPPPEWAASLEIRNILGAALLAANVGAFALPVSCFSKGAARATGLGVALVAVPLAIISASLAMKVDIPLVLSWLLAAHIPPLSLSGPWAQLPLQLAHTSVLLAIGMALAGNRLTRRA